MNPLRLVVEEAAQAFGAAGVTQLAQGLGFDLADALAVTSNCLPTSSSVWSVFISMPKRMRSTLASRGRQRVQDFLGGVAQAGVQRRLGGSQVALSSMKSPR